MRNYLAVFSTIALFLLLSLAGATYAHHGIASWFDMWKRVAQPCSVGLAGGEIRSSRVTKSL